MTKTNNLTLFSDKSEHVSIFDQRGTWMERRSMAAILEMPQYVVYQKPLLCSHSLPKFQTFNKYRTIMPISCA